MLFALLQLFTADGAEASMTPKRAVPKIPRQTDLSTSRRTNASTRCCRSPARLCDRSSKASRQLEIPLCEYFGLLCWQPGTTASELLDHLREEFDVPLHPHFVMRILELSIELYRKRDEVHGPVMKLQVPGASPWVSHVNVAESGSCGPARSTQRVDSICVPPQLCSTSSLGEWKEVGWGWHSHHLFLHHLFLRSPKSKCPLLILLASSRSSISQAGLSCWAIRMGSWQMCFGLFLSSGCPARRTYTWSTAIL